MPRVQSQSGSEQKETEQMTADELKVLCDLTAKLTEYKLKEVPHLCIENFAPELLAKLVAASNSDVYYAPTDPLWRLA